MKLIITLLAFLLPISTFAQQGIEINNTGQLKVLGHVERERLAEHPFDSWFTSNYDQYTTDHTVLKPIKKSLKNVDSIQVFFGSWCGDSKREVPRFLKIMDEVEFSNVNLIGLDHTFQNYKQSPFGEEIGLGIHRVPTFIFYEDSTEIGRIVEYPVESFELDIHKLITTDTYTPSYDIVHKVQKLLADKGADYILFHADSLVSKLKDKAEKVSALNTLAFKLFTTFQIEASEAVYKLNCLLFKEDYYPYYNLGRFYIRLGNEQLAKLAFTQGLIKNPENERLMKQLQFLN